MQKIKAKNEKLSNERQRDREKRDEIESKQKERKEKKDAKQGKRDDANGVAEDAEEAEPAEQHGGMHPARLAMMQSKPAPWRGNQRSGSKNELGLHSNGGKGSPAAIRPR